MRLAIVIGSPDKGRPRTERTQRARPGRPRETLENLRIMFRKYKYAAAPVHAVCGVVRGPSGQPPGGRRDQDRTKTLAKEGREKSEKGCEASDVMRRVCRASKACVIAAAGVLYFEWVQQGKSFWAA